MTYEKGVSVLLNAAPKVVGNGGYVKFVFIGGETQTISSVKPGT